MATDLVVIFKNSVSSMRALTKRNLVKQLLLTQAAMVTTTPFHRASLMVWKALRPLPTLPAVPEGM